MAFSSCGKDSNSFNSYYLKGKQDRDAKILQKGFEKADPYFSKLCLEELCSFLPKQRAVEFARRGLKKYPDSQEILELLVSLLFDQRDYSGVMSVVEENSKISKNDEIKRYYFSAKIMKLKAKSLSWEDDILQDIRDWYENNGFSKSHNKFFADFLEVIDFSDATKARQLSYLGNYAKAATLVENSYSAKEEFLGFLESLTFVEFKDIADTFVSGSSNKKLYSTYFGNGGLVFEDKQKDFYSVFSAGRILEKAVGSTFDVQKYYNLAVYLAPESDFDRALWYYLRGAMNFSISEGYKGFLENANAWKDPTYFDDILEKFTAKLLSNYQWETYYQLFSDIYPYLSFETQGKCDYLFGSLIEANLIDYGNGAKDLAKSFYQKAFENPDTDEYYKILAGIKLDKEITLDYEKNPEIVKNLSSEEEYLKYLLEDDISSVYSFALANKENIRTEVAFEAISALEKAAETDTNFYPLALRTATTFVDSEKNVNLLYPRYFSEYVEAVCKQFELPEYLLYGLMRTESYFDSDVYSVAGAIGLCQLMPSTAGDVARKLKIKEYDLIDAKTNITFGGFYLGELASRLDGNYLLALCSYNGGITNVRNWRKKGSNLPMDIFLETVPFEETRNYGKKLIKASTFYGMLYYQLSPAEIVEALGVF